MPGLYGGIGCRDPHVYSRIGREFEEAWGECESRHGAEWLLGGHAFGHRRMLGEIDGRYYGLDGEYSVYSNPRAQAGRAGPDFRLEGPTLRLGPTFRGNLALIDPSTRTLRLATESSGTFPLYIAHFDGGLLFSSHIRPLARAISAEPDHLGILEFLRNGFTFAGRSVFEAVQRLLPGQSVYYDVRQDRIAIHETSRAWVGTEVEPPETATERAWQLLHNAVKAATPETEPVGLMMSAGWDSRTLLASLASDKSRDILCYTHGDTASRELRLAASLCGTYGLAHRSEPIDHRAFNVEDLSYGFRRVENVVFPHWHRAGKLLGQAGATCAMAGVYGEVLGGHYGPAMLLRGPQTMMAVGRALVGRPRRESRTGWDDSWGDSLKLSRLQRHWYLNSEFERAIPSPLDRMNADIDAGVERLCRRGIASREQLVEAFITEHRGTQYINAQLLSCRASLDVALPFAARDLFTFASRLSIHDKVHNILNREILRRHAPPLLRFPMAATLVPARMPVLVQEASRLVRRSYETSRWRLHFRTHGKLPPPRLGWANFEFLRSSNVLRDLVSELRGDFWDRGALQRRLESIDAGREPTQLHAICDQLAKVYTVELLTR